MFPLPLHIEKGDQTYLPHYKKLGLCYPFVGRAQEPVEA